MTKRPTYIPVHAQDGGLKPSIPSLGSLSLRTRLIVFIEWVVVDFMSTTDEECVTALLTAAERLGESPTKAQYEELGLTPASATIIRVMGGWNDAKEAADLETSYSTGSRVRSKPDDVDIPADTSWEELTVDQRWHYRNVERNNERTLQRRAKLRAWLYEYKMANNGCNRCEEDGPACLDFHHLEVDEKVMAVNKMVVHGYGKERLTEEIAKCELLCANCHRKEHHHPPLVLGKDSLSNETARSGSSENEQKNSPTVIWTAEQTHPRRADLRAMVYEYRLMSNGCVRCEEADPACLDFHHVDEDEKIMAICDLIAYEPSDERLFEEIEKCELLCANCHRKEHYQIPEAVSIGSQD